VRLNVMAAHQMTCPIPDSDLSEPINEDRLFAWANHEDHLFRGHRNRLVATAPKIATLITTSNPLVSDQFRLAAEVAVDRGDDPVSTLVSDTGMSRAEIEQIAATVSEYADTHWMEVLGVLGRKTKMKPEVIERIVAINPEHIGADWRDHPDELHSLLDLCPTLLLPDTVEGWDVLYHYWNARGPLERDAYRPPKLWYLMKFQHLYKQRFPGITLQDMDAMLGDECDLNRVWGYCEFASKLLDTEGKPDDAEGACVPFLSQFEPAELVKQAELCRTEMVRIADQAIRSQYDTFKDWPRLIQGVFKSHWRTAVSLVTPAELMREGAMLSEFLADFPNDFVLGRTHIVAILSPEGEHLSTAEILTYAKADDTHDFFVVHYDVDGNEPTPECTGCVGWLTHQFNEPAQDARLTELERRFAEPDQAMRTMIAQFKLKSAALGGEALSAVLSNCPSSPERHERTPEKLAAA
ncbi:MAG: hypothetical protein WCP86_08695, partial [bacterium]